MLESLQGLILGVKRSRVNKSIFHDRTTIHRHSLGGVTSRQHGIELYECLLVVLVHFILSKCEPAD